MIPLLELALDAHGGLAAQGVAYVPFSPLGGFTPLQSSELDAVAASVSATPMQVALAWLLRRSPAMLPIPGTVSLEHLKDNLGAADIDLTDSEYEALG